MHQIKSTGGSCLEMLGALLVFGILLIAAIVYFSPDKPRESTPTAVPSPQPSPRSSSQNTTAPPAKANDSHRRP